MIFVDSSAWFAYLVPSDPDHAAAFAWMAANTVRLITTDYVVDETLTLLRARGERAKAVPFGTRVFSGVAAALYCISPGEIDAAWTVIHTYTDKDWSFTDCTSKVVMESFGISEAFAFDQHFRQFGTVTVV